MVIACCVWLHQGKVLNQNKKIKISKKKKIFQNDFHIPKFLWLNDKLNVWDGKVTFIFIAIKKAENQFLLIKEKIEFQQKTNQVINLNFIY